MSTRFPPGESSSLGDSFEAEVKKHWGENPNFKYKDEDGAPIGPFAVLAYTPEIFAPFMRMGDAILNQKDFSARERELCVLAVMAVYDVPFVLYAHSRIAMQLGLSEEQVSSASNGTTPKGISHDEAMVYSTALKLARSRGPLDEQVFQHAESVLGKERVARVAQVVGFYLYSSTLLNVGAIPAPEK